MSESRVREVVEARLKAFNVTECEIAGVFHDGKGAFDAKLSICPIVGKRPGSISTQANAVAVKVISALNTATDDCIDCGMLRCDVEPLSGSSEKPVMPMLAKFSVIASPPAPTPVPPVNDQPVDNQE